MKIELTHRLHGDGIEFQQTHSCGLSSLRKNDLFSQLIYRRFKGRDGFLYVLIRVSR